MSFLALALLTLTAQAADPAGLTVSVPEGFIVRVDDVLVPVSRGQAVADDLTAGRHEVEILNSKEREIFHGMLDLPAGYHLMCNTADWELACPEILPIVSVATPATPAASTEKPRTGRAEQVGFSWGIVADDATGSVTMTVETHIDEHHAEGGTMRVETSVEDTRVESYVEPTPPPPPLPDSVRLVIRSRDGEWADVLVDGRVALELRNDDSGTVTVSPGRHRIEVRAFIADSAWTWGTLETGYASTVTLGIQEDTPVECYDHDGWNSESTPVARPVVNTRPTQQPRGGRMGMKFGSGLGRMGVEVDADVEPAVSTVAIPSSVKLVVRSKDGEWADVLVDGKVVAELRNTDDLSVTITPGVHTIEVRTFMEDRAYASGRLETGTASRVTLGIEEGRPIECYDHDGFTNQ